MHSFNGLASDANKPNLARHDSTVTPAASVLTSRFTADLKTALSFSDPRLEYKNGGVYFPPNHTDPGCLMKTITTLSVLLLLLFGGIAQAGAATRSYVNPGMPGLDGLPFSGAVRVGDTLYLSGEIGLDENQQVPATASDEAKLLMDRFQATLAKAGYTMDDLVTVTVYCSDVKHYADFNAVYRSYFKQAFPARAFIGAGTLLFNARFEIQGVAVKREE